MNLKRRRRENVEFSFTRFYVQTFIIKRYLNYTNTLQVVGACITGFKPSKMTFFIRFRYTVLHSPFIMSSSSSPSSFTSTQGFSFIEPLKDCVICDSCKDFIGEGPKYHPSCGSVLCAKCDCECGSHGKFTFIPKIIRKERDLMRVCCDTCHTIVPFAAWIDHDRICNNYYTTIPIRTLDRVRSK